MLFQVAAYSLAEHSYRQAIGINPENGHYHDGLALALYKQTRYEEAVPENRKAVELEPTVSTYWQGLADSLTAVGKREEARAANVKAEDLRNQHRLTLLSVDSAFGGRQAPMATLSTLVQTHSTPQFDLSKEIQHTFEAVKTCSDGGADNCFKDLIVCEVGSMQFSNVVVGKSEAPAAIF